MTITLHLEYGEALDLYTYIQRLRPARGERDAQDQRLLRQLGDQLAEQIVNPIIGSGPGRPT